MTIKKPIHFDEVEFAMITALAKKSHLNPEQYLKRLIRETYERIK